MGFPCVEASCSRALSSCRARGGRSGGWDSSSSYVFFVEGAYYVELFFFSSHLFFFFLFSSGCFETALIGWLLAGRRFLARSAYCYFFFSYFVLVFFPVHSRQEEINDKKSCCLPLFRFCRLLLSFFFFFFFLFGLVWMLYTGSDFDWARLLFVGLFVWWSFFFFNATSLRSCEREVTQECLLLVLCGRI